MFRMSLEQQVLQLYAPNSIQCGTCGLRMLPGSDAAMQDHYDWHFRQNKVKILIFLIYFIVCVCVCVIIVLFIVTFVRLC